MKKVPDRNSSFLDMQSSVPHRASSVSRPPESEDLRKANSKLVAELFIKNKIIHDLTVQGAWKKASELSVEMNHGKLFSVLQKVKVDLEKAYCVCEQNSLNILTLQKQKTLVCEENVYLRSILAESTSDLANYKLQDVISAREPTRVEELEEQLRAAALKEVELTKQVHYWTNVSKKSQEAKLKSEATSNVLAKELQGLKNSKRTSQKIVIDDLEDQLKEKEQTIMKYLKAQEKIEKFSESLEEAYATAEKLENENTNLKENLQLKETLIVDLKEQLSILIEKEEILLNTSVEFPKDSSKQYESLYNENQELKETKKALGETLDKVNKQVSKLDNDNQILVKTSKIEAQKIIAYENKLKEWSLSKDQKEYASLKDSLKEKESIIVNLQAKLEASDTESKKATFNKVGSENVELLDSRDKITELTQELKSAQEKVESQKKELASKESKVNEMNEKLDLLTAEISKLQRSSFMMDEKDKQVIELLDRCEKSCADYENKSAELDKLQQDAKEIQQESVNLKTILKVKEEALEAGKSDVTSLKAELESKEEAIQHFILQYGNLEQKNAKLEHDLDVYSKSNDSSLLIEMEKLKERNLLLEEQLHEMLEEQEKFENSSSQMSELKLQEELANQALNVVQTDLFESKEEIKKLQILLNDSKSGQELLQKKMAYYAEKLDKYEYQLEAYDGIVASSNSTDMKAQKLMEELEASEGRNKVLEKELLKVVQELQSKFDEVPEKSCNFNESDSSVKAELEEKIKQLSILEHEHKSLGNLFSILKTELDAKDSDSKMLKKKLDLSIKELDEEKNIVINMKKEFKEIESLKNVNKSDQKEIQEMASTLSIISEKNSHLEEVIKKLEKELADLHKQEKSIDSALETQIFLLEKEIETQVASLKRRDNEAKELKEKYLREKQEYESLIDFVKQADVPSLLTRVGYLEKLASEYESKVTKTMNDKTIIESRLSDSEAVIIKLQDEISSKGGSAIEAPQVLIEKQQKIDELSQLNGSLFKKIETLTKMLEAADSASHKSIDGSGVESIILASRKQAEDAESAIQALSTEVSQAYEKINALLGEKDRLENEIINLKNRS